MSSSNKDWVIAEFSLTNARSSSNFINQVVAEFGYDIEDTVLGRDLHVNREIIWLIGGKSDITTCFEFRFTFRWCACYSDGKVRLSLMRL